MNGVEPISASAIVMPRIFSPLIVCDSWLEFADPSTEQVSNDLLVALIVGGDGCLDDCLHGLYILALALVSLAQVCSQQ
jgi:hypothetical protein